MSYLKPILFLQILPIGRHPFGHCCNCSCATAQDAIPKKTTTNRKSNFILKV